MNPMKIIASVFRLVVCAIGCAVMFAPLPARAQLTLILAPAQNTLLPGETATLTGTLTNIGVETVSLLGTSLTLNGPDPNAFTVDATAFEDNLPFTLDPSSSYAGTFTATFAADAPRGAYSFTYGVDGQGNAFYRAADTANFNLGVAPSAAPEPGSLLLAIPLLGSIARVRRRSLR